MLGENTSVQDENLTAFIEATLGPSHIDWSTLLPITIIYSIFLIVGVCGNLITCIVILNNEYMWTATNVYLLNLAVADIATLVISKLCRVLTNHFLLGPHSLLQSSQLKKPRYFYHILYYFSDAKRAVPDLAEISVDIWRLCL